MEKKDLEELLNNMTIEEKAGQLMQFAGYFHLNNNQKDPVTGPDNLEIESDWINMSGSILGSSGAEQNRQIQEKYLQNSRLSIPLIFMADVINGYRTIFPIPLGLGATWDPKIVEKIQSVSAKEAASAGVHVTFAPMVDLVRDPRWGRVMESTGEDPLLNEEFARASVRGIQGGEGKINEEKMAACVKHFVGYGAVEGGRDYNTVDISERSMREFHFPAFKGAIKEGVSLVMTSFNIINGVPATANQWVMNDILRKEFGFDGVLISDFSAVKELIVHSVAKDEEEAGKKALDAGLDIEMMSDCYKKIPKLISSGKIEEEKINEAVMRVLTLKNDLSLFENPYKGMDVDKEEQIIHHQDHRELSRIASEKSSVLLKNNGALPLKNENLALIGPYADNQDILGEWSIFGKQEEAITLKEGFENAGLSFDYAQGSYMYESCDYMLKEALKLADKADHLIVALGEGRDQSGEARSKSNLRLADNQLELLRSLSQKEKQITVILFNARPLELQEVHNLADSILEVWHPGSEGGNAICNLLTGKVVPSGKLTMSFPRNVGQIPVYYNAFRTGRPLPEGSNDRFFSRYLDIPNESLYPFGYGLSYADFVYENINLSSTKLRGEETIFASVSIFNKSDIDGEEIVQLYICDKTGEVVRPVKELKDYKKIYIPAGNTKKVYFEITKSMLKYYHADSSLYSDSGEFVVYIGKNSNDVLEREFFLEI